MARLRKFIAYQKIERPYTRVSKYKKHSFVKARPHSALVRFEHGDPKGMFETTYFLIAKQDIQIRSNALESARQTSNRVLEGGLGKKGYFMRIRKYPFHILRENPMATGAGADRMSQGMTLSFGKPIGIAVQARTGSILMEVRLNKEHLKLAKLSLQRATKKLPGTWRVAEASSLVKAKKTDVKKVTAKAKKLAAVPKKTVSVKKEVLSSIPEDQK